jgi:hypothetical protein
MYMSPLSTEGSHGIGLGRKLSGLSKVSSYHSYYHNNKLQLFWVNEISKRISARKVYRNYSILSMGRRQSLEPASCRIEPNTP